MQALHELACFLYCSNRTLLRLEVNIRDVPIPW
jgi:hypothetical protein